MKYLVAALYILSIVCANLTASVILEAPLIGQFAMGTLFFGAVFTLRDYISNYFGKRGAYKIIALAIVVNFLLGVIGAVDVRILIASLVAASLSEATDTEIYHALKSKYWPLRILASNSVSIPLDTILFTFIAFYGIWSTTQLTNVIIGDILVKFIISSLIILIGLKVYVSK